MTMVFGVRDPALPAPPEPGGRVRVTIGQPSDSGKLMELQQGE